MKKIFIVFMALLIIGLVSCGESTTNITTVESSVNETTQTTTEYIYDDRSLVPEDCEHLENIGDYQPVWCDEFNYEGLPDTTKWAYNTGGDGFGNNELQYYTNADPDNAYVSDGTLKITALLESYNTNDYTSARLVSKYYGEWTYGKIQVRAKLPSGVGTWPAIWMMPTNSVYGGWPYSGEIDIMEHVGKDPNYVHTTIHTGAYNHSLGTQIGYSLAGTDWESEFHVYEIEWSPGHIETFVDGVSMGIFGFNPLANPTVKVTDAWPFDIDFYLILNLAIGGFWGGPTVDDTIFPQSLEVDYVRVYQKDYAGLDREAPSEISNLTMQYNTYDSIKIIWNDSEDDIMVKEYEILVDDVLHGTSSVNAFDIEDLDPNTTYKISVMAVDFAGNRSSLVTTNLTTANLSSVNERIEAEDYDSKSGVYIGVCTDGEEGECLTWISDGDYMEYSLYVPETGTYRITYRISSESDSGTIELFGLGPFPLETTVLPITGSYDIFVDVTSEGDFSLREGIITFKIKASLGGFYLNYFEFEKVD